MSTKFLVSVPLSLRGTPGDPTTLTMLLSTAAQQEAQFAEDVVVYADEQGTSNPRGGVDFAVGLEFGATPMPATPIEEALDRRKCDIVAHSRCRDKKTNRRRAFFHATDDCEDCRAILVSTIRNGLRDRFFLALRWHFPHAKPDHPEGAELHRHVIAMLLGLVSSVANVQRITFKFERVQGLFVAALNKWLQEDIDVRINVMLRYGLLLNFVPVEVSEAGKEEHGIQVCDHLLWRQNRALSGKTEALEDAGMIFNHSQDHPPYMITLYQHGDVAPPRMDRLPEPRDPGDIPWCDVVVMLYSIEATVHNLARMKPVELRHLDHVLTDASQRTRGKVGVSLEDFVRIHTAFLTVVGLYARQAGVTDEQRQAASDLVRLAMIISQQHETRSISMLSSWRGIRQRIIEDGDAGLA